MATGPAARAPDARPGEARRPATEPVLRTDRIQGNVLPGFETNFQALLFLAIRDVRRARAWLRDLAGRVTSMAAVLAPGRGSDRALVNVAFSFGGLRGLTPQAEQFTDPEFKEGMCRRSMLLGDPTDPGAEGNPVNWVIGGPANEPDVVLILGADTRATIDRLVAELERELGPGGCALTYVQHGARLRPYADDKEHFGYRDNISQPGVRGRLSHAPDTPFTARWSDSVPHEGRPGQFLVWPGEFVFGYPQQDPLDRFAPGAISNVGPAWATDGSLLVFRRLRQDVEAFESFLRDTAERLAGTTPIPAGALEELVAAKLMGRWRSGAPVLRTGREDRPAMGADPLANNHFAYIRASPSSADGFRASPGDREGLVCPHAAHIRRAYPRDAAAAGISEPNIETHRLLRRGIPFGDRTRPGEACGLLFLAYQTSLERQFEFITRAWLNNPHFRTAGDGHDPIVGQCMNGSGRRTRTFNLPLRDETSGEVVKVRLTLPRDWVVPTGGGYYFSPALDALAMLADGGG